MLQGFIDVVGFGLCHQIRSRTFEAGGFFFPVCARDTGIFLGFIATLCILALLYRTRKHAGFPPIGIIVLAILSFAFLAFDGATSYLGLRETTNLLRYITGVATGATVSVFLYWATQQYQSGINNQARVLGSLRDFFIWLFFVTASMTLFYLLYPYGQVISALIVLACMVAVFYVLCLLIIQLAGWFKRPSNLGAQRRIRAIAASFATLLVFVGLSAGKYLVMSILFS